MGGNGDGRICTYEGVSRGIYSPLNQPQNPNDNEVSREQRNTGATTDPELALINAAWSTLPAAVRAGIMAMIRTVGGGAGEGEGLGSHSKLQRRNGGRLEKQEGHRAGRGAVEDIPACE